jgi:hypothetical protein
LIVSADQTGAGLNKARAKVREPIATKHDIILCLIGHLRIGFTLFYNPSQTHRAEPFQLIFREIEIREIFPFPLHDCSIRITKSFENQEYTKFQVPV